MLACRVVEPDQWCRRCGCEGPPRDTVTRRLAHEPLGWRPTMLEVVVRRYRCTGCGHVWRQDTTKAAEPRAKLSRRGLRWALEGIVVQHLTVARVAEGLGVAWNTANDAVLAEGKRVLIDDAHRFDGRRPSIGVDEHVWRHTRRGDKYVTVIIDLTEIRDGTGPARLLDMVEGRSKQAFKTWLAERDAGLARRGRGGRDGRVHRLQDRHHRGAARRGRGHGSLPRRAPGRRRPGPVPAPGPAGHPRSPRHEGRPALLARGGPCTPAPDLLTDKQIDRLTALFADRRTRRGRGDLGHLPAHDRRLPRARPPRGRELMVKLIESTQPAASPSALTELITLGGP